MKCQHLVTQLKWRWFGRWLDFRPKLDRLEHDAEVCVHCGAWLSLGPARETPETAVEVRAAEIAADSFKSGDEWYGYDVHITDRAVHGEMNATSSPPATSRASSPCTTRSNYD